MFEHWFSRGLAPLIVVSAAFTALIFVLVPLLDRGLASTDQRARHEKKSRHALVGVTRMPAPANAMPTSGDR